MSSWIRFTRRPLSSYKIKLLHAVNKRTVDIALETLSVCVSNHQFLSGFYGPLSKHSALLWISCIDVLEEL
jgi:hypothetical protein